MVIKEGLKEGLEDVVAASSAICDVKGDEGRLIYRGYDIHDLAEHSTFEEVVYLLWFGHLPKKAELEKLHKDLANNRALPASSFVSFSSSAFLGRRPNHKR